MPERKSTASKEGYKVLSDQDLLNGVEARARQLEAERSSHLLFLEEAKAIGDDTAVETHTEEISKIEGRLEVVHARRDTLKSNMPKGSGSGATTLDTDPTSSGARQ